MTKNEILHIMDRSGKEALWEGRENEFLNRKTGTFKLAEVARITIDKK